MTTHHIVTLSLRSVIQTTLFFILLFILFLTKEIIFALFFAVILMSAFNQPVIWFEKNGVPRPLAIFFIYVVTFVILGLLLTFIVPPLATELTNFVKTVPIRLPQEFAEIKLSLTDYSNVISQIGSSISSVLNIVSTTFSTVFFFVTVIVMSFYMLLDRKNLHKKFGWFDKQNYWENLAKEYLDDVELQLGSWVRGQLFLMFVIGLITYIFLALLSIPYALPLAVLAGLLEILPNIGPTIASIPAIVLAFLLVNPTMGGFVALFYIVVQQLENNLLVPRIMKSAVNVEPLTAIIVILMGVRLGGVAGALLSIPFYLMIRTAIGTYQREVKGVKKS